MNSLLTFYLLAVLLIHLTHSLPTPWSCPNESNNARNIWINGKNIYINVALQKQLSTTIFLASPVYSVLFILNGPKKNNYPCTVSALPCTYNVANAECLSCNCNSSLTCQLLQYSSVLRTFIFLLTACSTKSIFMLLYQIHPLQCVLPVRKTVTLSRHVHSSCSSYGCNLHSFALAGCRVELLRR